MEHVIVHPLMRDLPAGDTRVVLATTWLLSNHTSLFPSCSLVVPTALFFRNLVCVFVDPDGPVDASISHAVEL